MKLFVKKLNDLAIVPTKGSKYSAGYDLYSIEEYVLKPNEYRLFKTGISIAIPEKKYGRIAPRSGLAKKNGIDVLAGVIDEDYRGEIGVILINFGSDDMPIKIGDRIAQIIIENYNDCILEVVNELNQTERGEGGFGSTESPKKQKGLMELYQSNDFVIKEKYIDSIKNREER